MFDVRAYVMNSQWNSRRVMTEGRIKNAGRTPLVGKFKEEGEGRACKCRRSRPQRTSLCGHEQLC